MTPEGMPAVKIQCFGHGPKWHNQNPDHAREHDLTEDDAARFISMVTQGGYGDESVCVLDMLDTMRE